MDFVTEERYKRALQKSIAVCPCRWRLQRYMVLTPLNHNAHLYQVGDVIDGWLMSSSDIVNNLSGGAIGIVETRPTARPTGIEEAAKQAEAMLKPPDYAPDFLKVVYYGWDDKRRISVRRASPSVLEHGVDPRATGYWWYIRESTPTLPAKDMDCETLTEAIMLLAFDYVVSTDAGWRPCLERTYT